MQKNFSDKAEARRVARAVLGGLVEDAVGTYRHTVRSDGCVNSLKADIVTWN
jgi:hypothetical protein